MKKLAICFALLLLSLSANEALGCICVLEPNLTPEKDTANRLVAFEKATAIFTGEVVSLDLLTVKFKVDKIWKGEEAKEVTMLTGTRDNGDGTFTSSSCDYHFEKGAKYLIYAYGPVGKLQTHFCSRTMLLESAEKEMRGLDQITTHKSVSLISSRLGRRILSEREI